MPTLLTWDDAGGQKRRCDAKCYNAKHAKCTCICGGTNHGKGLKKAIENTMQMADSMLSQAGTKIDREIPVQLNLPNLKPGDIVRVRAHKGKILTRRVVGLGKNVVFITTEEEYQTAIAENRDPICIGFHVYDVIDATREVKT